MANATLNLDKMKRDIEREVKMRGNQAINSLAPHELRQIGNAAIVEMKEMIAKGVSPIKGRGRFPAYKWAAISNSMSKSKSKARRRQAKDVRRGKYPWSVMHKYPNKQVRPVNLYLSGEFLNSLVARPINVSGKKGVEIGFNKKKSELKEQGHREGVNTQPKRPIIPKGREEFTPNLYRRIVDTVTDVFSRKFKT